MNQCFIVQRYKHPPFLSSISDHSIGWAANWQDAIQFENSADPLALIRKRRLRAIAHVVELPVVKSAKLRDLLNDETAMGGSPQKNVIVLIQGDQLETWGSLTEICRVYPQFSYDYLKKKKFPFEYKGIRFIKAPFRAQNGINLNQKKNDGK